MVVLCFFAAARIGSSSGGRRTRAIALKWLVVREIESIFFTGLKDY